MHAYLIDSDGRETESAQLDVRQILIASSPNRLEVVAVASSSANDWDAAFLHRCGRAAEAKQHCRDYLCGRDQSFRLTYI